MPAPLSRLPPARAPARAVAPPRRTSAYSATVVHSVMLGPESALTACTVKPAPSAQKSAVPAWPPPCSHAWKKLVATSIASSSAGKS